MITGVSPRGLAFDPLTNDLFVAEGNTVFQFTGPLTAIPLFIQPTYSASSGAPVLVSANAGPGFANLPYVIGVSLSGSVPGILFNGAPIPLNPDLMTDLVLIAAQNGDPRWAGFIGTLNAAGVASATFMKGVPIHPSWVGISATLSLVVMSSPIFASPAAQITVVP